MSGLSNSELDSKLRDISVMYELVSSIGTSLNLNEELDRFLQKLLKRFGYSLGAILIKEGKEDGPFIIQSASGFLNAPRHVGEESQDHLCLITPHNAPTLSKQIIQP